MSGLELVRKAASAVSLDELAGIANRADRQAREAVEQGLVFAAQAGEALLQAKQQTERGKWRGWLDENFAGGRSTAYLYMRIAQYRAYLAATGIESTSAARRALEHMPEIPSEFKGTNHPLAQQAEDLRRDGATIEEVAEALGISRSSAWAILNPGKRKQQRETTRKRREQERRALARQDRDKAAKAAGGVVAECYSLVRKTTQAIAEAVEATENPEVRQGLNAALAKQYEAEDAIVRIIGIT